MEWLKRLLGDDKYSALEANGALKILKEVLGENEYIQNDPTKIIPKAVFNQKNDEAKNLKATIDEYKKQLEGISTMVTDKEMKTKLAEQEAKFTEDMKTQETLYTKELETSKKKYLLTNLLSREQAKHIDLLMNAIDLDSVVMADDTIVNHEKILNPLKENYKELFGPSRVTGQAPPAGNQPPPEDNRKSLVEQYNKAGESGNMVRQLQLMREIKGLDDQTK